MAIWFSPLTLAALKAHSAKAALTKPSMINHLGIELSELGEDFLVGTMPVDERTRQPYGLLHGGASAALAETLASMAANLVVNPDEHNCVGLELNANHIGACRDGLVTGRTSPLHLGRTTQVWETRITQDTRLICVSRLTLAVLAVKKTAKP